MNFINMLRHRQFNKEVKRVTAPWAKASATCAYDKVLSNDERIINDNIENLRESTKAVVAKLRTLEKRYPEERVTVEGIIDYMHDQNSLYLNENNLNIIKLNTVELNTVKLN